MRNLKTDSGVSEVIGFILLVGISLTVASSAVVLGSGAVESFSAASEKNSLENTFAQFGSEATEVGLTGTEASSRVSLGVESSGTEEFIARDNSRIRIQVEDESGDKDTILSERIGYVQYKTKGGSVMTFENGGVWSGADNPQLISPPEFHYRGNTLTMPLITSSQEKPLPRDSVFISQEERSFKSEQLVVDNETIFITIESPVYQGWGEFFEDRIEGDTDTKYDHTAETVEIELGLDELSQVQYDAAITSFGDVVVDGGEVEGPVSSSGQIIDDENISGTTSENEEVEYGDINDEVNEKISEITENGEQLEPKSEIESGQYYVEDDYNIFETTFDVSDGDVEIGVPEDITISGSIDVDLVGTEEEDSGKVKIYTQGDVDFFSGNSSINEDGGSENFHIYGVDTTEVNITTNMYYEGIIFAPREDSSEINSGGNNCNNTTADICLGVQSEVVGGVIGGSTEVNSSMTFDESLEELDIGEELIEENRPELVYLHVSVNEIAYE